MRTYDHDLTFAERSDVLAALEVAGSGGLLAQRIQGFQEQFGWSQSEDFYTGFARGLMVAARLCQQNPEADPCLLAGLLLLHSGVVVKYLEQGVGGGIEAP